MGKISIFALGFDSVPIDIECIYIKFANVVMWFALFGGRAGGLGSWEFALSRDIQNNNL
jgi:hypothetical protein